MQSSRLFAFVSVRGGACGCVRVCVGAFVRVHSHVCACVVEKKPLDNQLYWIFVANNL